MNARRFPAPWTSEDHNNACFIVKDVNGQAPVLRARARTSDGGEPIDQGQGAADCDDREVAGAGAKVTRAVRAQLVLKMLGGQLVKSERKMPWRAWTQHIRRSAANWIVGSVGGR
jgi:hypothetical protein